MSMHKYLTALLTMVRGCGLSDFKVVGRNEATKLPIKAPKTCSFSPVLKHDTLFIPIIELVHVLISRSWVKGGTIFGVTRKCSF